MVLEEISRLSTKLNQLLQFSRPAVRGRDVPSVSDSATVLREVVGVLRPEADRRGISIRLELATETIPVAVGPEALNDIFSNLVVNALEATTSGGAISAVISTSNGTCLVNIEDDGPGIPIAVREKFFSRFSPRNRRERVWVWPLWRAALPSAMENLRGKVQFETDAARDLKSVCPLLRRLYEDNSDRGR